jgi:hypothetical protein
VVSFVWEPISAAFSPSRVGRSVTFVSNELAKRLGYIQYSPISCKACVYWLARLGLLCWLPRNKHNV